MRQDTLYMRMIWGARVRGVGASFMRNLLEVRQRNPKPRCTCHERWVGTRPNC